MELLYKNASENPTSMNAVSVLKLAVDEITYFKGLKYFLDSVEIKVEKYMRKYKFQGEIGFAKQYQIETSESAGKYSGIVNSIFLPKKISWHFSSDLSSNYLRGEVNLGNYFVFEGNWGYDSDVKAMFNFPF